MDAIKYAQIETPTNIAHIVNTYSTGVLGVMSPYPTVVIVVSAQYTDMRY